MFKCLPLPLVMKVASARVSDISEKVTHYGRVDQTAVGAMLNKTRTGGTVHSVWT